MKSGDNMEKKEETEKVIEKEESNKKENTSKKKQLCRSEKDSKLVGVCGGFAEYFNIDSTLVRVIWIICSLIWGIGLIAYLLCALIMPKESEIKK